MFQLRSSETLQQPAALADATSSMAGSGVRAPARRHGRATRRGVRPGAGLAGAALTAAVKPPQTQPRQSQAQADPLRNTPVATADRPPTLPPTSLLE